MYIYIDVSVSDMLGILEIQLKRADYAAFTRSIKRTYDYINRHGTLAEKASLESYCELCRAGREIEAAFGEGSLLDPYHPLNIELNKHGYLKHSHIPMALMNGR